MNEGLVEIEKFLIFIEMFVFIFFIVDNLKLIVGDFIELEFFG